MPTFTSQNTKCLSIILPTKDRAYPYLDNTLSSFRDFIQPDHELIVIDGLSSDKTIEVVNKYSSIIDIFISEPDSCTGEALNKGFLLAKGRYLKVVHDDDIFYQKALNDAVQVMDSNPEIDVLLCGGTRQQGDVIQDVYVPPGVNYGKRVDDVAQYTACGCGLVVRRSSLSKIGLFDTTVVPIDIEFVARSIYLGANVKFCRINMFHHPILEHSTVAAFQKRVRNDIKTIKAKYGVDHPRKIPLRQKYIQIFKSSIPITIKSSIRAILNLSGKKVSQRTQIQSNKKEPIWDGGFS